MNLDKEQRGNFERAFSNGCGSIRSSCHCGREFYSNNDGADFDEGELESLRANPNATALDYSVSYVEFESVTYCADCDCWHKRAEKIIAFIEHHGAQIADFLTLEKQRKQQESDRSPVVKP